ncbi:ECO1 [Candida pseudojiufengensis]|uniref:ECO1 n=1 Tax=Candida pseudojiufengensis TaxID=497109 RepID=UPI002224A052|nr:ECO1 [Candida pseudojiufengensis]KAI5960128.1 ECO1 [Candida pseudojiufengensis]
MAIKTLNTVANKEKVQSILTFNNDFKKTTTCTICEMIYNTKIPADVEVHKKYHLEFTNGISWPSTLMSSEAVTFNLIRHNSKPQTGKLNLVRNQNSIQVTIQTIDKSNKRQIGKIEKLLNMVNQELDASDDSKQWRDSNFERSKAFVVIINNKAMGLCTTDTVNEGKWMIFKNQKIVPNQQISGIKIGISRIWISPKWRRLGLGLKLLNYVCENSIYGQRLQSGQIAFSQPSSAGGKLAKSFNGVKHKSGEILIPVYL